MTKCSLRVSFLFFELPNYTHTLSATIEILLGLVARKITATPHDYAQSSREDQSREDPNPNSNQTGCDKFEMQAKALREEVMAAVRRMSRHNYKTKSTVLQSKIIDRVN